MKERIQGCIAGGFQALFMIYMIGTGIAFPYFNYRYAVEEGFTKWLFFGQIVPTGQSFIWPFYAGRAILKKVQTPSREQGWESLPPEEREAAASLQAVFAREEAVFNYLSAVHRGGEYFEESFFKLEQSQREVAASMFADALGQLRTLTPHQIAVLEQRVPGIGEQLKKYEEGLLEISRGFETGDADTAWGGREKIHQFTVWFNSRGG